MTRIFPRTQPYTLIVDPAGCGCTDCIVGESKPADLLTEKEKDFISSADYNEGYGSTWNPNKPTFVDRTSYTEEDWDTFLL